MGLVQHASITTTTGTTATATFGSATTPGNCLIVCVTATTTSNTNPTISSIKIGGSADNFAQANTEAQSTNGISSFIWTDQNIGVSSTSVVITFNTSSGSCVDVYEWSDVLASAAVDKTNGAIGSSSSWSSGSSGTLTQLREVAFGVNGAVSSSANTITGPSSPWTNSAQLTTTLTVPYTQVSGYQAVSATTALTYSGTDSAGSVDNATCIVTLKLATPTLAQIIQANQSVMRAAIW